MACLRCAVKQLNTYFDFVKSNLASSVPKAVMFFYCYPLLNGLRDTVSRVVVSRCDASDSDSCVRSPSAVAVRASQREPRAVGRRVLPKVSCAWALPSLLPLTTISAVVGNCRLGSPAGEVAAERQLAAAQLAVLTDAWNDLRQWQAKN